MPRRLIPPEVLLNAYAEGIFPMAESRDDDTVFWVEPKRRGILPLDAFHISHSLKRFMKKHPFDIRFDTDFKGVMKGCAERDETWINDIIVDSYCRLFELGFAHSVECYKDGRLAGGLYGVCLKGAFFGESMFSRETNASKTALCALVDRLKQGGFTLLDTQFLTSHLATFGGIEIPQKRYLFLLKKALRVDAVF